MDVLGRFLNYDNRSYDRQVLKKGVYHNTQSGAVVISHANNIMRALTPYSSRIEIVGSIRRGDKNPIDVDILIIPKSVEDKESIKRYVKNHSTKIYADGPVKLSARVNGIKTEIFFTTPESYGAAQLTYTGSAGHNIGLRAIARKKGLLLNQYGLYRGNRLIAGITERQIYQELDRPTFKKPADRQ